MWTAGTLCRRSCAGRSYGLQVIKAEPTAEVRGKLFRSIVVE